MQFTYISKRIRNQNQSLKKKAQADEENTINKIVDAKKDLEIEL